MQVLKLPRPQADSLTSSQLARHGPRGAGLAMTGQIRIHPRPATACQSSGLDYGRPRGGEIS